MLIVSFAIHHSVARRWICGVVSRTEREAVIFNATFSIYRLFASAHRWPGVIPQKRTVHRPWIFIHSYH